MLGTNEAELPRRESNEWQCLQVPGSSTRLD
ncbi:unnamed protein product [Onchocerca flexuosa]|uniref:Uncharacterized protein n=1 Tax=Onchocerca flexuosa TaxID=387005 RepID=A0A183I8K5_9BILA|nr:unnamed protein product [Onchocerca flexuosa]